MATVTGPRDDLFRRVRRPVLAEDGAHTAVFPGAGLPSVLVSEIKSLLWAKFCNAIGIFGVSALTRLPSIEIFARPQLAFAYRSLLEEAALVAAAEGVPVADFPDLPMRTYLEPTPEEAVADMSAPCPPGLRLAARLLVNSSGPGRRPAHRNRRDVWRPGPPGPRPRRPGPEGGARVPHRRAVCGRAPRP